MVKTMTMFNVVTSWLGVSGALRLKFTVGIVASAAKITLKKPLINNNVKIFFKNKPWLKNET